MIASILVAAIGLLMAGSALVYGCALTPPKGLGRWVVCALCAFIATEFSFMPMVRLADLRIGDADEGVAMLALAVALKYGVETLFKGVHDD